MSNLIDETHLNFFRDNGYLVVDNVISDSECELIMDRMNIHADKDFSAILNPDRMDFLIAQSEMIIKSFTDLPDKVSYILECKKTSDLIRSYLKNKNVVDIIERLQGREIVGLMCQMLYKKAGSAYAPQAWTPHQDNSYIGNKNGLYITTNLFMNKANKENGSMFIYKKSHLHGIFDAEDRPSYREAAGNNPGRTIDDSILKRFEKVDLEFNKGSLLVLHGNCIHGSYPNNSRTDRPLLSCSYIPKGEYYSTGHNAQRKEINLH